MSFIIDNSIHTRTRHEEPAPPPTPVDTNNGEDERLTFESWPLETHLEARQDDASATEDANDSTRCKKFTACLLDFYFRYDFPIHVLCLILLAYLYPPLGAIYVYPYITANWVAVCYIFTLFGLGVKTDEFSKALTKWRFNAYIQLFNFGFISAVVFGVTRLLAVSGVLSQSLADGIAICSCLPMSINVGIVLTSAAGGDEAVAIFNTSFGNFTGVFLSPALILGYLGTIGYVNVGQVYLKLSLIVIAPLVLGQLIQRLIHPLRDFYFQHKRKFKKSAEWALAFIIFTIFSQKFMTGTTNEIGQVFIMIFCILCFIVILMATMWFSLKYLYPNNPELRATGTFISIQKTIALGVPLITSIYGGTENLANYTLPILVWHPMQLVLGSILVPRMAAFIKTEKERLAAEKGSEVDGDDCGDIEAPAVAGLKRGDDHDDEEPASDDIDVDAAVGASEQTNDVSVTKECAEDDDATAKSLTSASECSNSVR